MTFREQMHLAARGCISRALDECGGNVAEAAKVLGVHRIALYKMMQRHGVATKNSRPTYSDHDKYLWRELHLSGLTAREIAAKFECGRSTVARELSRERLNG